MRPSHVQLGTARPRVVRHDGLGLARQQTLRNPVAPAGVVEQGTGEQHRIAVALAHRRDPNHGDGQALIEVLAKVAQAHRCLEVAVGRRDDLHVDAA
jgi:hypothetical protein